MSTIFHIDISFLILAFHHCYHLSFHHRARLLPVLFPTKKLPTSGYGRALDFFSNIFALLPTHLATHDWSENMRPTSFALFTSRLKSFLTTHNVVAPGARPKDLVSVLNKPHEWLAKVMQHSESKLQVVSRFHRAVFSNLPAVDYPPQVLAIVESGFFDRGLVVEELVDSYFDAVAAVMVEGVKQFAADDEGEHRQEAHQRIAVSKELSRDLIARAAKLASGRHSKNVIPRFEQLIQETAKIQGRKEPASVIEEIVSSFGAARLGERAVPLFEKLIAEVDRRIKGMRPLQQRHFFEVVIRKIVYHLTSEERGEKAIPLIDQLFDLALRCGCDITEQYHRNMFSWGDKALPYYERLIETGGGLITVKARIIVRINIARHLIWRGFEERGKSVLEDQIIAARELSDDSSFVLSQIAGVLMKEAGYKESQIADIFTKAGYQEKVAAIILELKSGRR